MIPSLTDTFLRMLDLKESDPDIPERIFQFINDAPESPERDGLLSLIYHEGIGVPVDLEKSFDYAEKAIDDGKDPLGYYILGYMCDNAETPDQATGGPRLKYDHYDAEGFYEKCAEHDSHWKAYACSWLGDYFLNMARGGDPELGIEYLEKIAENDAEAAGRLSDHFWDIVMPDNTDDTYWTVPLFRWTKTAARLDPEEYTYRLGCIYADGIGCERSFWLALKYFGEAFLQDDWRGAESIANLLEQKLQEDGATFTDEETEELRSSVATWRKRAEDLRQDYDAHDHDSSIEED